MAEKKLKIIFLSFYNGLINRGVENVVYELASRLSENHSVIVVQADKSQVKVPYKVEVVRIQPNWNKPDTSLSILRRAYLDYWSKLVAVFTLRSVKYVWREKPDIVVTMNGGWQPAVMRIITWLYGGKLVITGQSGKGWDDRNNLWCFPNTFVALSDRLFKWSKKANPFVKVVKIPNGVDAEKFSKSNSKKNIKLPKPIVLTVGALTDWKRIDLTIKAVGKLEKGSLVIVGDGDKKEYLQNLAKKLLPKRHLFLKADPSEMPKIYNSADVFAFSTSPDESFGIVLLEAMASSLPVVATNDPIRAEIIGNAGILVDPTDSSKYAKAIEKALDTKWGDKPIKQAEKFDWNKIAKEYESLFFKLTK